MKKRIIIILVVLALSFSLTACNKPKEPEKAPVEFTVAFSSMPNGLDPVWEDSVENMSIAFSCYDKLVEFDMATNAWIPSVAKSWERIDDVTWNFEINLDYKFSNGDQLTMDDVVYSLMRLKDIPKTTDSGALIADLSYKDNILTFKAANNSNTTVTRVIAIAVMVNKKYIEANGDDAIFTHPVSTGPYKVTEFTPGASITIETWDGYPFEKPQVDKVNFIAIGDSAARYIALETGSIQYAWDLNAFDIELAGKNDKVKTESLPSRRGGVLVFNCERPPFDDVNVRRGMTYALDRIAFASLMGGRGTTDGMLFEGYPDLFYESSNIPGYDLDKARELLEGAGISPANPINVDLIGFMSDPGLEMYQSVLKSLGVEMTITVQEISAYIANEGDGNFDMCWTIQGNRHYHPLTDLDRYDYDMLGTRDISRYYNPRVQELIGQMRVENDQQKLKAMSVELNDILAENVPMVFVIIHPIFDAMTKGLDGILVNANGETSFRNAVYNPVT